MLMVDLNYNFECDWFVEISGILFYNISVAQEIVALHSFSSCMIGYARYYQNL